MGKISTKIIYSQPFGKGWKNVHPFPAELKRSGIYQIRNIINGNKYIGSAIAIYKRRTSHLVELRGGRHHSGHLQGAFKKYGEEKFVFEVIEFVKDLSILIAREQHYLDSAKPEYNISPTAGNSTGTKRSQKCKDRLRELFLAGITGRTGMKNSPEHIERTRQSKIGKKASKETRRKQSLARLGKPAWNKGLGGTGIMKAWNKGKKIWYGAKCTERAHEVNQKKVFLFDIKNNSYKKFDSIKKCREYFGVPSIQHYVNKPRVYSKRYIISFSRLSKAEISAMVFRGENKIVLTDKSGKIIKGFDSIVSASRHFKICKSVIYRAMYEGRNTKRGIWKKA